MSGYILKCIYCKVKFKNNNLINNQINVCVFFVNIKSLLDQRSSRVFTDLVNLSNNVYSCLVLCSKFQSPARKFWHLVVVHTLDLDFNFRNIFSLINSYSMFRLLELQLIVF